jgi:putative PIN family toxin of toxin-antitoxin system
MIFLQAAARPSGPAAALLELVEIGELELFVSEACREEIREVLVRPSLQLKFPSLTISTVSAFPDRIQACSVYSASVPSSFLLERDPKDSKYVDLAIATKADFLVTRDKDILDLREQGSPLLPIIKKLGWMRRIVDPFEM